MNNFLKILKANTKKVCLNCYDSFKINCKTGELTYQPYRREDFNNWSKEAFANEKLHFYADPVDPDNRYGKYKLAEPRYVYKIEMTMTEEQYKEFFLERMDNPLFLIHRAATIRPGAKFHYTTSSALLSIGKLNKFYFILDPEFVYYFI